MDASLIPLWVTSTFSAVGVVYAIVRNGKKSREQEEKLKTELKMEIKGITKQLSDPENGLSAIKKSTEAMKVHCAEVSTRIDVQARTNAEEISLLRKRKR